MGAVYRAWDNRLQVHVALKEMVPQPRSDAQTLAAPQFYQEAQVLARLSHLNPVRVTASLRNPEPAARTTEANMLAAGTLLQGPYQILRPIGDGGILPPGWDRTCCGPF